MRVGRSVLAGSLVAAALGCVGTARAADPTVALVLGVKGSPFYQALACGAQAKAKELGLALTVSAPDQFAADLQIPVVNAVAMNTLLGGKGSVLVITQPPGSAAQDARTTGFEAELKKYPGLTYLGAQYQSDDPQKAAEIVTSTLSAHPDLAGLFSTNDQGAIGALTGLRQAGALGKVKVVAYDAATAEVNAFKNGAIAALIAQNPKQEGEVAMESAAKLIKGEALPKTTLKNGDAAAAAKYEYKGDCQ